MKEGYYGYLEHGFCYDLRSCRVRTFVCTSGVYIVTFKKQIPVSISGLMDSVKIKDGVIIGEYKTFPFHGINRGARRIAHVNQNGDDYSIVFSVTQFDTYTDAKPLW